MAACDIDTLLAANPCYAALNPLDLEMVKTALLCRLKARIEGGPQQDCDTQALLTEAKCFRVMYPSPLDAVQAELLLEIAGYVGIPALDGCMAALSPWNLQLVTTQLLCIIAQVIDGAEPPTECDIQTLLADASCYNNLSPFMLSRLQASQLCQIVETVPPTPPTPPVCALTITSQPSNFSGDTGDTLSFTVAFTGAVGTPTIQWQHFEIGEWLDLTDGDYNGHIVTGAQTTNLQVINVTEVWDGDYRAIITDPAISSCTATSDTATATIAPPTGNGLLTALLAYYRFEEGSGNALDSSGNNRTLLQTGTILGTPTGIVQAARTYSATDGAYFRNGSAAFAPTAPFSVTLWAKFNPRAFATNDFTLAAKGSYTDNTLAWWLLLDHGTPDDSITFYYTTDGFTLQSLSFTLTGGVDQNVFYFIALRWDGATFRLTATPESDVAVAGDVTAAFAGTLYATPDDLVVGAMPNDPLHGMDGIIDELGLWGAALSDCQLNHLFTAKAGSFTYPAFDSAVCV